MSRFWEIVFCLPLLFRRDVCFTLRHASYRWPPAKLCSATLNNNEGCARGELGKGDKNTVWGDKNNDTLMGQLKVLQNKAAKVLLNLPPRSSSTKALVRLDLKNLSKRRHFHRCVMIQKYLAGEIDFKFDIRRNSSFHSYQTRRSNDLHLPRVRTDWGKQTFIFQASKDWNNLQL